MSQPFNVNRIGDHFCIAQGKNEILTPNGNLYITKELELAQLVCKDFDLFGKDINQDRPSYVDLMARYCDGGQLDKRDRRILGIMDGYGFTGEVSIHAIDAYNEYFSRLPEDQKESPHPTFYFGEYIPKKNILSWINSLSMRALISVNVICNSYHSVLGGYYLLSTFPSTEERFIDGLIRYGKQFFHFPYGLFDAEPLRIWMKDFFAKAKLFASFFDDPFVIHRNSN